MVIILQIIQICELFISRWYIYMLFFFLKGIMIVHEIKIKNKIFNVMFF